MPLFGCRRMLTRWRSFSLFRPYRPGAIVGPRKAAEFQSAWANHVEGLLAYSTAVAGNDEAAKTTAAQNLDGFASRLALFFSDIVRNELPVEALTDVLSVHDTHLVDQVDAYAANDYAKAQQMQLEGYQPTASPQRPDPAASGLDAARGFRSARGYRAMPLPVRLQTPKIRVASSLDRLGRRGTGRSRCRAGGAWPAGMRSARVPATQARR
jgi:hypothetical protein